MIKPIPDVLIEKKIKSVNAHWQFNKVHERFTKLKKRGFFNLFFPVVTNFELKRAVILMGPRRVGKTVLLFQSIQKILRDKILAPKDMVYFSIDEPLFFSLSLEDFLNKYKKITGEKSLKNKIIFFDEIQYLKNWEVQLKILVDTYPKTKFIVSGSAAGALKHSSHESGAGRFTDFMLPPLTFYEYLNLLDLADSLIISHSKIKESFIAKNIKALNKEFINYLNYGAFPETLRSESIRSNPDKFIKQDIIEKTLLRDLPSIYGINDIQELNKLFNYLAYHTGNEMSYEVLSQSSGVAKNTLKKYIEYLEAAFLIKKLTRINDKGKTFIRANTFKVYLTNPSIYSAIYGVVEASDSVTLGQLVETAIFSQWIHNPSIFTYLHYAKVSQNKGEVDFVHLNKEFKVDSCLEVKWSDQFYLKVKSLNALLSFCKKNHPNQILITTKTKNGSIQVENLSFQFKEAALLCYEIGRNQIVTSNLRQKK